MKVRLKDNMKFNLYTLLKEAKAEEIAWARKWNNIRTVTNIPDTKLRKFMTDLNGLILGRQIRERKDRRKNDIQES